MKIDFENLNLTENPLRSALQIVSTIWTENTGIDRILFLLYGILWQLHKRLGYSTVTRLANGARLKVYPNTAYSAAFYTRWIERKDLLFIRAHADLAPTFVDVGANVGLFSASLFDRFSYFILIEPMRSCITALHETCALNPSVQSEIINVAVSDRPGIASFLDEGEFSTTSRIVTEPQAGRLPVESVAVETLDRLLREHHEDFVVKVDIEGHEEQLFHGARKLFDARQVKLLMFERLGRTNIDNVLTFFDAVNYVVFYVKQDGTITFDDEKLRTPLINLFACPRSVLPRIVQPVEGGRPRS